ncbi:ubiquinone biosynthesis protein COQ4 mitochondrial [Epithele typhae]|uniref:ubiquinone biosynthesis protein COQ4 mitochondrial n=1 Tax=Epithele typhae TaxID=378194 RepID=UPI0020074EA2|nr:ubiquinone biosynthesis protein COQ4 mitochondrial [Epithele typhae]KAH9945130.1 ubiquinone biosynthesis protein COQ4 mitochondrial [Epithele typhae]
MSLSLAGSSLRASRHVAATTVRPAALSASRMHRQTRSVTTPPNYEGHIPLNWLQTGILTVGSAVMSLADPYRHDMVAALGDLTSGPVLPRLRDHMLASAEGRAILKQRPRINTTTVDLNKLAQMPEGSFGRAYIQWLERCAVTPDTREPVHYVDDPELAYVMQRYRESHDFYHCLLNMPVHVEGELAVKAFELANLGLPMAGLAAVFGPLRLTQAKRERLFRDYVPWALQCGAAAQSMITVYWERRWEMQLEDMKREFGIWDPPVPMWWRKARPRAPAAEEQSHPASS